MTECAGWPECDGITTNRDPVRPDSYKLHPSAIPWWLLYVRAATFGEIVLCSESKTPSGTDHKDARRPYSLWRRPIDVRMWYNHPRSESWADEGEARAAFREREADLVAAGEAAGPAVGTMP